LYNASKGHEIGVTADLNSLGGTDLYAIVAFPAHFGSPVPGLVALFVQDHQVIGTDVLACSSVQCLASVTFISNYKTGHDDIFSVSDDIQVMVLVNAVIDQIKQLLVDLDHLFMVDGPVIHPGFIHPDKGPEEIFSKHLLIQEGLKPGKGSELLKYNQVGKQLVSQGDDITGVVLGSIIIFIQLIGFFKAGGEKIKNNAVKIPGFSIQFIVVLISAGQIELNEIQFFLAVNG
jgi:hypothetical protein